MTIKVTPEVDTLIDRPRIRLTVVGTSASPNAVGTSALVALWRVHPDGTRHRVILQNNPRLSGGSFIDFDYAAPFNRPVSYIASSSGFESDPAPMILPCDKSWLIHPTNPDLSVQVGYIKSFGDIGNDSSAVLSYPFRGAAPIRISEGARRTNDGELSLIVQSEQMAVALKGLFADDSPVLFNLTGPDLNTIWRPENWAWISPGKTALVDPVNGASDIRYFTIPYTIIATPDGVALPTWTCDDVTAAYATCTAVAAAYASCDALTTNTLGSPATGSLIPDPGTAGLFIGVGLVPDPAHPGLYYLPS